VATVLPRWIEQQFENAIRATPVVVLEGGRAVGKSTLCDAVIERNGWAPRVDLADPNTLALLRNDPIRFLDTMPLPAVIDEAQLEPQLPIWIKQIVDRRRAPGQFVLTGSARLGRNQLGGSDPLAGRSVRHLLWSFADGELGGRPTDFMDRAFGDGWDLGGPVITAIEEDRPTGLDTRRWLGGLPGLSGVLRAGTTAQWEREMATYVESVLPLGSAGSRADLGRLLTTFRYLAANSGQILNVARAANELGSQANTVRNQIEMLEACFLLFRVEAERPSEHKVVIAHPRLFATDLGLAAWAARAWDGPTTAALLGSLSETAVAHDLAAAASAHRDRVVVRHWRDARNTHEVDLLLVHPDGRLVAVEVKASSTIGPADARPLVKFAESEPDRMVRGIVVYEGSRVTPLHRPGEREILALPRTLLSANPQQPTS
jgi:uncharacterized protein